MSINSTKKYIGFLGATLGILQGLAWTILSLMVILLYLEAWKPFNLNTSVSGSYGFLLEVTLYELYISDLKRTLILTSEVVLSISIIYLIISLAWIASSSLVIQALVNEDTSKLKMIYKSWSSISIVTSTVDFIVLIIAVIDFVDVLNVKIFNFLIITATGIIMTIAARGFTLWVINVALAVLFFLYSAEDKDEILDNTPTHIPSQSVFNSSATPTGNVNKGFNWENEKPKYPHSSPYPTPQNYGKPEVLPKPMIKPTNERLAKIGKPPARFPPHNVPPPRLPSHSHSPQKVYPRVPSPDYSPPNSPMQPQLKSALKGRPPNAYTYNYN